MLHFPAKNQLPSGYLPIALEENRTIKSPSE